MRKLELAIIALAVCFFAIGAYFYPQMPEKVASHWGAQGQVNGYMSRFWGVFFMPFLSVFLAALFLAIPRIDPMKANIAKFQAHYERFILVIFVFFLYIYLLTIAWNLGYTFDMLVLMVPGFALLLYYVGVLLEHAKMNWFIGIRTPWSMSSERVWDKTHALGAKLFKICGALSLFGIIAGGYSILFVVLPVILVSVYLFIYSYIEYKKEKNIEYKKEKSENQIEPQLKATPPTKPKKKK